MGIDDTLKASGYQLGTPLQNLIEFWNSSTRPINRNGFGFSTQQTNALLQVAKATFPLLLDSRVTATQWEREPSALGRKFLTGSGSRQTSSLWLSKIRGSLATSATGQGLEPSCTRAFWNGG